MKKNKRVLVTAFFFMAMFSSIFFLKSEYKHKKFRFYSRYWRHRQNSIEFVKDSLKKGFKGVEVDIHFDDGKFYLSHDPKDSYRGVDTLSELLEATRGEQYNLWLDFKNLSFLNARKTCSILSKLFEKYRLYTTALVESKSFAALHVCRQAKLPTSFWISFSPDSFVGKVKYRLYKFIQQRYRFRFVSVDKYLGDRVLNELSSSYEVLLFTIRTEDEKKFFSQRKNVKAILVAKGISPAPPQ